MNTRISGSGFVIVAALMLTVFIASSSGTAMAQMTPGSVEVSRQGPSGIDFSLGLQVRLVPTSENNWDFGMGNALVKGNGSTGFADGSLSGSADQDFTRHATEAGNVGGSYTRTEDRIYFKAQQKGVWSVFLATELDTTLDNTTADRGGRGTSFGIEKLDAAYSIPRLNSWLHAGWNGYGVDGDAGGIVYLDDDPGIWLSGSRDKWGWQFGYHNKIQANGDSARMDEESQDRNLWDVRIDYLASQNHSISAFYQYDDMNSFNNATADPIDARNSRFGGIYKGRMGLVRLTMEGVYQYGRIKDLVAASGLQGESYDVMAYAGFINVVFDLGKQVGMGFAPHIALQYSSGDDDSTDHDLTGYTAAVQAQRLASGGAFSGENTIVTDGNGVLGTFLYGWFPEFVGNQNAYLISGGAAATARADNPGLTAVQAGFDLSPAETLLIRSDLTYLRWNEGWAHGVSKELGYEWDNQLVWSPGNVFQIKAQGSLFLPCEGVEDRTDYLKDGILDGVGESDDIASRVAMELVWVF